ncbi:MAG: histidine kinase [Propionibacterium sp.]|nr:MAG: histidine kinase [Propionibacterium sp.]
MKCISCGADSPFGSRFCNQCGNALSVGDTTKVIPAITDDMTVGIELDTAVMEEVDTLGSGTALLVIQRGSDIGARFLLDAELTSVGRHPDSDIFLDDVTVSRHHAKLVRQASDIYIEDLGSLNGTYVNRKLVDGRIKLRLKDEVQIGKFRLVFFTGERGLD